MRVVYTFFEGACSVFYKISCGHRVDFEKNVRKVRPHSHFYLGSKFSHFQILFSQALCTPDTSYLPGKVTPALETSQVAHILYISICSLLPSACSFTKKHNVVQSKSKSTRWPQVFLLKTCLVGTQSKEKPDMSSIKCANFHRTKYRLVSELQTTSPLLSSPLLSLTYVLIPVKSES